MSAVTRLRDSTALHTIQHVTLRDLDGTMRDIQFIKARDANNVSQLVFLKPAGTGGPPGSGGSPGTPALSVTISPASIGQTLISTGAAINFSGSVTANVIGGAAPYTYAWTIEPGSSNPATITAPSAASTNFTATLTPPSSAGGWYDCAIVDANGLKASARVGVNFQAVLHTS
jgi:hypothetical protein